MKILKKQVFEGEGDDKQTVFLIVKDDELNEEWFRRFVFNGSIFMIVAMCFSLLVTLVLWSTGFYEWDNGKKMDPIEFWLAFFVQLPFILYPLLKLIGWLDKLIENLVKYCKRPKKNTPANPRM